VSDQFWLNLCTCVCVGLIIVFSTCVSTKNDKTGFDDIKTYGT